MSKMLSSPMWVGAGKWGPKRHGYQRLPQMSLHHCGAKLMCRFVSKRPRHRCLDLQLLVKQTLALTHLSHFAAVGACNLQCPKQVL